MKHKFSKAPRKGTLSRFALTLAMRPEGVTIDELAEETGRDQRACHNLISAFGLMQDMGGWDIRSFPCPPHRIRRSGVRRPRIYKVVGKMRWDGTYRSFTNPS